MHRTRLALAAALAAGAGIAAPDAGAATLFGPPIDSLAPSFGTPADTTTTGTMLAGGASAAAPVSGVLTQIRLRRGSAGADPGVYAYRIMSGASPNLIARPATPSGSNDVYLGFKPSSPSGIDTYFPTDAAGRPAGIPIAAGEFLGVWTLKFADGGAAPAFTSGATGAGYLRTGGDTLGGPVAGSPFGGFLLQLQGRIEPDADGDGYGDETQDPCPATPGLSCPAPVQTIIVPGPTITVPGPTVVRTVACKTGTKPNAARTACVKIRCKTGTRLSGNRCLKIRCRKGTKLRGNRCVKLKAKAKRSAADGSRRL